MELTYVCTGLAGMNPQSWEGHIRVLHMSGYYEIEATARQSTFHIIFGNHQYGNYICIPNWGIGTELSCLDDSFWNLERLESTYPWLSTVDTISIVSALAAMSNYIVL
ncbi:MAG: hypothetical protein J6C84_02815 [Lachnospiraceae bacterium]|nr:hypothetical protein [Lachnospiraceae bacterium]